MKKIRNKILAAFLLTSSLFILLTGSYSIHNLIQFNKTETAVTQKILFDDYDKMIKNEVETAGSILNTYYETYIEGLLTEREAQEAAKKAIKNMRYGEEGYFWIDDINGILIAHPMLPEQEGTDRSDIKDSAGTELIKEVIQAARDHKNSGFTDFMWEKPQDVGSGKLSPKRAYSQLFEPWNWIVSTGNYVDNINLIIETKRLELSNNLTKNIIAMSIFLLFSLLAISVVGIILSRKIANPIIKLVKAFQKDDDGQISIREIKLNANDEIGLLAATLNEMTLQFKGFINGVVKESNNAADSANIVEGDMSLLSRQINEISATTEEISAGMEETAASAEEMNAVATEIAESVGSIAVKAKTAAVSVQELNERAGSLKGNLSSAAQHRASIMEQVKENLDKAVEESKSVTQINELADAILQITGQTNLLALNAAIEAARAGEAGQGFAVVADEIRKLAEDSKNTAGKIQSIIKRVINSVDNLSANSTQLMEFMETNVKEDYNLMLKASDEYAGDAGHLEALVRDFHVTAERLHVSIGNMLRAIEEISSATNEGAEGANNIVHSIVEANEKSQSLLLHANESKEYSKNLINLIGKFKL
ncbi:MAG: methyl-accepting chemotaxis protein [Peptococcaceae bacterium]